MSILFHVKFVSSSSRTNIGSSRMFFASSQMLPNTVLVSQYMCYLAHMLLLFTPPPPVKKEENKKHEHLKSTEWVQDCFFQDFSPEVHLIFSLSSFPFSPLYTYTGGEVNLWIELDYQTHEFLSHKILKITVEDSGIGISDEARVKLFQPFNQAQKMTGILSFNFYLVRLWCYIKSTVHMIKENIFIPCGLSKLFWILLP